MDFLKLIGVDPEKGKRQTEYRANQIGNGYLLVIYHPDNNAYISEVTGMPQTQAMTPLQGSYRRDADIHRVEQRDSHGERTQHEVPRRRVLFAHLS